jgi:hypothetical protein
LALARIPNGVNSSSLTVDCLLLGFPTYYSDLVPVMSLVKHRANHTLDSVRDIVDTAFLRRISIWKMHTICRPVRPCFAWRLMSFAFVFDHGR